MYATPRRGADPRSDTGAARRFGSVGWRALRRGRGVRILQGQFVGFEQIGRAPDRPFPDAGDNKLGNGDFRGYLNIGGLHQLRNIAPPLGSGCRTLPNLEKTAYRFPNHLALHANDALYHVFNLDRQQFHTIQIGTKQGRADEFQSIVLRRTL